MRQTLVLVVMKIENKIGNKCPPFVYGYSRRGCKNTSFEANKFNLLRPV